MQARALETAKAIIDRSEARMPPAGMPATTQLDDTTE